MNARAADAVCPPGAAPEILGAAPNLANTRGLRILAIGSSSTEGVGASSKDKTYPARLAVLLSQSRQPADVRNAGVGGEVGETTLRRLEAALIEDRPQLVLWQVGANDAMTGVDLDRFRAIVVEGVATALARKTPILLIDPQFTARETTAPRFGPYADVVDDVARDERIPVVRRYASMRALSREEKLAPLLSADGLHMSDLGYDCLAGALAQFIAKGPNPR